MQALSSGAFTREVCHKDKGGVRSTQQCLNICGQAAHDVEKLRVNIAEDVSAADNGHQILVSTVGDLISAQRATAGARSLRCSG